jgi:hypothetical protein
MSILKGKGEVQFVTNGVYMCGVPALFYGDCINFCLFVIWKKTCKNVPKENSGVLME